MLTLKVIRKTVLYKALMEIPGVELMEIDKELQAAATTTAVEWDISRNVSGAFMWDASPQGHHFWAAVSTAQKLHRMEQQTCA